MNISYQQLVDGAKTILEGDRSSLDFISELLKAKLFRTNDELTMHQLPNGEVGAVIVHDKELRAIYRSFTRPFCQLPVTLW